MDRLSDEHQRYNHLVNEIDSMYHEIALKFGLSDACMMILYTVYENKDAFPISDICRISGISKQTINSAIRKLEMEGLVFLKAAGRRKKTVCFTENGKAFAKRTVGRLLRAENEIFAEWEPEERQQYLALTERYLEVLKEKAKLL